MHFYSFWLYFSLLRNLGQEELILKMRMWHETKQTNQDNPPSTNSNSNGPSWVWPVGLIPSFIFHINYHDTEYLWWCSKLTKPRGTRIFIYEPCSCRFAIKKNQSIPTLNIALVHLEGAANAIGTEHSCCPTHWYFTDGTACSPRAEGQMFALTG